MVGRPLVRAGNGAENLRSPRGLGRDLAAILENSLDRHEPAVGLTRLLGEQRQTSPSVRRFVVDVALAAIAEAFEADAVVLARTRNGGDPPVVSTRLPPSWNDESGVKFELIGQVWSLLREQQALAGGPFRPEASSARSANAHRIVTVDGLHTWIGGHQGSDARLAAAVARRKPLTDREQLALARVVRSVASAVDDEPTPLPNGSRLSVSLSAVGRCSGADTIRIDIPVDGSQENGEGRGGDIRAVVALRGGGERRTAAAEGPNADMAIAEAAVELAGASNSVSVGFAGRAAVEDMSVSIVVLDRPDDAPLLGLVVSDGRCGAGPAEAVFAALAG